MQELTTENKTAIKVLHINCNYLGTPLHQFMVQKLEDYGIENRVFVPISPKYEVRVKPNDYVTTSMCFSEIDRYLFFLKQKKIYSSVIHNFDVTQFSCIHAYTLFTDGNCAMRLSQKYSIPYIVAVRDTDINVFFNKIKYLRSRGIKILRKASRICFLSEKYLELLINDYVPPTYKNEIRDKSVVIPNGIDEFWHQNSNIDKVPALRLGKDIKLVYAGRIMRRKNLPSTLKACEELILSGYNASLTVVGKKIDEEIYNELSAKKFVRLIPALQKEQLIDIYRGADIFVMASFTETFGLVYPEAMSQGLPVIYTRGQGFDGQFPEGYVGYSVDPNNPREIVDRILDICCDYRGCSTRAIQSISRFSWDKIVMSYIKIYGELL